MASSVARTWTRPTPTLSHPLVCLSFSHDASCVIAADASTVHWLTCDTFALRGLYQERHASRAVVAACGDMLEEKSSTCAVVTTTRAAARPAGGSETTTFAVRRWRPGYLNYHWRYDEWAADIEAVEVRAVGVLGDKTFLVLDGRVDVYGLGGDGRVHVLHRVETRSARPLCAASRAVPVAFACAGAEVGEVRVERWAAAAGGFAPLSSFRAHSSRLECVAVSWDGRFVATASFKGTIVRVFHAADGMLLREVRSSHSLGD
jgi:hypothetical protein